ncbi:MAG TPA: hypothetical protein VF654_17080 [Pyrinomonadaceae bacterium]
MPTVLAASFLLFAAAEARAKEVVGIVTSVSGKWYANGVQLSQGQKLMAGVVIKAKEPNVKYGRVVVMLLDYSELSRICDRKGLCGEPLALPEAVNPVARERARGPRPPGFWERFVDALALSRRRPARTTLARGGDGFVGAVVKLEGGRIELNYSLAARVRRYSQVDIESVGQNAAAAAESPGRVPLRRAAGGRILLDAQGVTPGLYKMTFDAPAARGIPPYPYEVLALVAGPQEYPEAARQFRRARELSARWGSTESGAEDFQRTFLRALAADEAR